jgi:hypothetical protein
VVLHQHLSDICGDNLFRPHVLADWLTAWNFKAFLEYSIPDFLADVSLIIPQELHCTHDDAATHFNLVDCRFLDQKFPGR